MDVRRGGTGVVFSMRTRLFESQFDVRSKKEHSDEPLGPGLTYLHLFAIYPLVRPHPNIRVKRLSPWARYSYTSLAGCFVIFS